MAENKKSFILYCDQKGVWDKLNNEQAGKLIKHIIAYVNDENPITDDFITELAFEPIKQQLKRDLRSWEKQYNQRVEAGKKSAEVRKRNSTTVDERSVSSTVNGTVNVNVNGSEINTSHEIEDIGTKNGKFIIINPKYVGEKKYRVWGTDGINQFLEMSGSKLSRPEFIDKFLREKDGHPFNDYGHVLSSYNLFIEKLHK